MAPTPGLTGDAGSGSPGPAASTPKPGPLGDAATRLTMQRSLDFFDFYWQGRRKEWVEQDESGLREPVYSQMQVPRTRTTPRDPPQARPLGTPALAMNGDRRKYGGQRNRARNRALRRDVVAGAYGLVSFTQPLDLQLKRVLGKGGQGIACLFLLTLPDGTKKRLVVKGSVDEGDVSRELRNMRVRDKEDMDLSTYLPYPTSVESLPPGYYSIHFRLTRGSFAGSKPREQCI